MPRSSSLAVFVAMFLAFNLFPAAVHAGWTPTGPYRVPATTVVRVGGVVYVGTPNGIYRSEDEGVHWTSFNTGLTNPSILSLVASSDTLFVITPSGVYRSGNRDAQWQFIHASSSRLVLHRGSIFLYGSQEILRSTDNGTTWTGISISTGQSYLSVGRLASDGVRLFVWCNGVLFRSETNGDNWTSLGKEVSDHYAIIRAGAVHYMADGPLYRSDDGGTTWTYIYIPEAAWHLAVIDTTLIVVSMNGGVFRTPDRGATWRKVGALPVSVTALSSSSTELLAATEQGVYVSSDTGSTWKYSNIGSSNTTAYCFTASAGMLYAGTDEGLFLSTDQGGSWKPTSLTRQYNHLFSLTTDDSTVLCVDASGNFLRISLDGSRSTTVPIIYNCTMNALLPVPAVGGGTTYFIGTAYSDKFATNGGVFQSTNNGTTWTSMSTGLGNRWVNALAAIGSDLYAGTNAGVYRTPLSGGTWTNTNLSAYRLVYTLIGMNGYVFAGTNDGVYRSADKGANWTAMGLSGSTVRAFALRGTALFAGTDRGLYASIDNGLGWTEYNTGMDVKSIRGLIVTGSDLLVGTEKGGIWKRPLSEVTAVGEAHIGSPTQFSIAQNYPNPFNPSTRISFSLPSCSFVTLKVYDVMGREVATLVSEEMSVGAYSRSWNASGMSSGVYFYRLQAGAYTETKRMVLMK